MQCFFCKTEKEFDDLCDKVKQEIVDAEKQPLFEICLNRPKEWSPTEDTPEEALASACCTGSGLYLNCIHIYNCFMLQNLII